ncbi:MAG: HEPN domain-containing protein [Candidatus Brocadiaceae bacterium]|nr:HEPN domain-containing protein [Candidatus Brocadiaceae bacterium]
MNEEKKALINCRLSQAKDFINEAKVLLREGMSIRSIINRLYYAMFYAVLALLQEKQLGTSKHTGAISLFDKEFIKTGIFQKDLSRALHRAFELRQKGDYLEQVKFTREDVDGLLPKAEDFLNSIECYFLGLK